MTITNTQYIGKPEVRVDGKKKVTGTATYAGDFQVDNLIHGYVVESTIASGKITSIDTSAAKAVKGVLEVFTHLNIPKDVKVNADYSDPLAPPGEPFRPLYNDNILYNGQPIALVIAETFELARYAAGLVEVTFVEEEFSTDIKKNMDKATHEDVDSPPDDRGDVEAAFEAAKYTVDEKYFQPRHYHNPMEPFATIAIWNEEEGSFKIYDKIQGVNNSKTYVCGVFSLDKEKVRVISPFVGGGFGSGLRPQYQLFMAAMASRALKRPVKVALTRKQMFSFGHRASNLQRVKLAANDKGILTAIQHESFAETSKFEKFSEMVVNFTGVVYPAENVKFDYQLIPVNTYTPMDMRAPGGVTGMFALEIAIDELAEKAGIDPLSFRLRNYANKDHNADKPFSSKELKACYHRAAERIGWDNRQAKPKMNKQQHQQIGYGMATGIWEAMQLKASAKACLSSDGKLTVSSSTADIGTGTYTVMTQIAAQTMGMNMENVDFKLGDTKLPKAPIEGGSYTVSTVGTAVQEVCKKLKLKIFDLATDKFPKRLEGIGFEEMNIEDGWIYFENEKSISVKALLENEENKSIEIISTAIPSKGRANHSCYAHSCVMVKVAVDVDLGMIEIQHMVSAVAGGRIINPKTAENQILGGMTWGVSMALEEEGMMDDKLGRLMNANLAEYHVSIHADVQKQEVIFVEEQDGIVNPLGAKGLGEIGLIGVAAAISNAIYNATGKRVRDLPITLDKVM